MAIVRHIKLLANMTALFCLLLTSCPFDFIRDKTDGDVEKEIQYDIEPCEDWSCDSAVITKFESWYWGFTYLSPKIGDISNGGEGVDTANGRIVGISFGAHYYPLSYIPPEIGRLTELRYLRLETNTGYSPILPATIWNCTKIDTLRLIAIGVESWNGVGKLNDLTSFWSYFAQPQYLGQLFCLTKLSFLRISLPVGSRIPDSFSNLLNLNELTILGNQLVIPETISRLSGLTRLNISSSDSVHGLKIPEGISGLKNLKYLRLSGSGITSIPEGISGLSNLCSLWVSNTRITKFPEGMSGLVNLENLLAPFNSRLEALSEGFGGMKKCRRMWLRYNAIKKLPESIGGMDSLRYLDLEQNQIKYLPESIGQLKKIDTLIIWLNQIDSLPSSIGNLSQLKVLNVQSNNLQTLPASIISLTNLGHECFYLEGNRLCNLDNNEDAKKWAWVDSNAASYWRAVQRCSNEDTLNN